MNNYFAAMSSTGRYHATTSTVSSNQVKTLCGVNAWTEEAAGSEQVTARLIGQAYTPNSQFVECERCEKKAVA
jgi:hypothetical protein